MKRTVLILTAIISLIPGICGKSFASSFSAMSVDEVASLLDRMAAEKIHDTVSAKDTAVEISNPAPLQKVMVTAEDMMGKVYGVLPTDCSKQECMEGSIKLLSLTPDDEEDVLWLDHDKGYNLTYYGQTPDVSAMAHFANGENETVSDFGYFFLFPYNNEENGCGLHAQTDFSTTLLQELHDMGLEMELNTTTDALFEAVGVYDDSLVDVRLLDDKGDNGSGRYILILSVEPRAFDSSDYTAALD